MSIRSERTVVRAQQETIIGNECRYVQEQEYEALGDLLAVPVQAGFHRSRFLLLPEGTTGGSERLPRARPLGQERVEQPPQVASELQAAFGQPEQQLVVLVAGGPPCTLLPLKETFRDPVEVVEHACRVVMVPGGPCRGLVHLIRTAYDLVRHFDEGKDGRR